MSTTARKTKRLKYNLKDRGRDVTGQDRSNVDIQAMINIINGQHVQEMAATGSLIGFYGHQIRQRYGVNPPETALIGGKVIRLEPAFKTTSIHASADGTIEHTHEFFNNESGEYALRQYAANAGGFSTAVNYGKQGSKLVPKLFGGFDFVWQPNYATNVGDGVLLDGLWANDEEAMFDGLGDNVGNALAAQLLDQQIISTFDNIHQQYSLLQVAEQAFDQLAAAERENQRLHAQHVARRQRARERQIEVYDSMLCPAQPFDSVLANAEQFLSFEHKQKATTADQKAAQAGRALKNVFGRG